MSEYLAKIRAIQRELGGDCTWAEACAEGARRAAAVRKFRKEHPRRSARVQPFAIAPAQALASQAKPRKPLWYERD